MRVLKLAVVTRLVLRYAEGVCQWEVRNANRLPGVRRRVALPSTLEFKRLLSMDAFFLIVGQCTIAILSIVCQATHVHQAAIIHHEKLALQELAARRIVEAHSCTLYSFEMWRAFCHMRSKFFGWRMAILTDQGTEF